MSDNQNNTISVFLASSEELKQDRIAFGDFIRRLSDIFEKRGLCIKLKKWEDFDAAYNGCRKQDEYNAYVRDSNIFMALFYIRAENYTVEEFNVALEEYKRTGVKPEELLLKASVCLNDASIIIESRVDKARNHYIKADEIAQKVGYEKEKQAKLLIDFVDFSLKNGHYNDAVNYGNRQIRLSEELYGDSSIKITSIYNLMGLVYCDMGNYDKAKEFLLKAIAIREKELGPNHLDTACLYNNLAEVYREHREYRKALDYYIRASDVYLKRQVSPSTIATLLK